MKCYKLLLILFMVALKCGANEEPVTVNLIVENVSNSEVFNVRATEGKLPDFDSSSDANGYENISNHATDDKGDEDKKKEFGLSILKKLKEGTGIVKNVIGSWIKGLTMPNETGSGADCDEPTIMNYSKVENVTNSELINASTTEAQEPRFEDRTQRPNSNDPVVENTLINATNGNAISPFKNREFGKLAIPESLPQHKGIRKMTNIIGSLMDGIAQLNEPDSEEEDAVDVEKASIENCATDENVATTTTSEVSNASTAEVPENSTSDHFPVENTLVNATNTDTFSHFTRKEFGKLSIPESLPQHKGIRKMTNIIGSLMDGIAQLIEPDLDEDTEDVEHATIHNTTVENVESSEVFNTSSTEENTLMNAMNADGFSPSMRKEFGKLSIPESLPQHKGIRKMTNIIGSLMDGIAELNKPDSDEDTEDEAATSIYNNTVENVTISEVFNTSSTEENILMNTTKSDAFSPFTRKKFGKLSIPEKGIRKMTNIIGSLMNGIAQLNKPDSGEDTEDDAATTIHNTTIENVTSSEVSNTSTTEVLKNCGPSVSENTQMNATNVSASGPFKKKEFGTLSIPIILPQEGTEFVKNVTESLAKGFIENTNSTKGAE